VSCNATLFHSYLLQCLVWGCKHPCSINCAIIRVFFRWTHITWWGWQLKLNLASSSELLLPPVARIGTFVAIILLLREDSYSSSAFPPCESQPIDLLRYRLALPVACPLGNWLVPVLMYLGCILIIPNLYAITPRSGWHLLRPTTCVKAMWARYSQP